MALRPVSELGLVDVTDAATPEVATKSAARAGTRQRRAPKKAADRPARASRAARVADRTEPALQTTTAASRRSRPVGVGTSALSGAIGLAGSFLLARAVLQRGRG
jgi:hypothetical protein